jgi:hypothetical protein
VAYYTQGVEIISGGNLRRYGSTLLKYNDLGHD